MAGNFVIFSQLTVIHPHIANTISPTRAANVDSIAAEPSHHIPPQPAHNMFSQHHVESQQARTVIGHYVDTSVNNQAETILSGGSK